MILFFDEFEVSAVELFVLASLLGKERRVGLGHRLGLVLRKRVDAVRLGFFFDGFFGNVDF